MKFTTNRCLRKIVRAFKGFCHILKMTHFYRVVGKLNSHLNWSVLCLMWRWITMCHRLTNKSTSAFLPAGVIARNSQHQKFQYAICRLYKSDKPKPSLSWMKLCSSNNHYTTMYHCNSNHSKSYWALQFFSRAHAAFFHCLMAKTNIGFYCWTCDNKLD